MTPRPDELEAVAPRFTDLFEDGEEIWKEFQRRRGDLFHPFVPADYPSAIGPLRRLRDRSATFLELGSGNGVITILADLLGFEAYGIELDPWLTDQAIELAQRHGSTAEFVQGSFIPDDFEAPELEITDAIFTGEGEAAYAELGMDLEDFDLIYMFPWPDEAERFRAMIRQCTTPSTLFLTYDATDGFQLTR